MKKFISILAILCVCFAYAQSQSDVVAPDFYVTTDVFTKDRIIFWEKQETTQVDHYTIYRVNDYNTYNPIATVKYNEPTVYRDVFDSELEKSHSDSYIMTTTDLSGNETDLQSSTEKRVFLARAALSMQANTMDYLWILPETVESLSYCIHRVDADKDTVIVELPKDISTYISTYVITDKVVTSQTKGFYVSTKLLNPIDVHSDEYQPFTDLMSSFVPVCDFTLDITDKTISYTLECRFFDKVDAKLYVIDNNGDTLHVFDGKEYELQEFTVPQSGMYVISNGAEYYKRIPVPADWTAVSTVSESKTKVFATGNQIIVKPANSHSAVTVYNALGQFQTSVNINGETKIPMKKAGLYFVVVDGKAYKVVVE